jgi:YebC/PmpR family DNA-binding regulatory protein
MSGHSHWATIRRKKGAEDAKRGKLFTRLAREIVVAAREGGGDPETNIQLQYAIDRAKSNNMPKDNIERAIKRGTGELKEGAALEEIYYEGYAPHGVALMIFCVTDNRNRVVADIRHVLTRSGGSMAEAGSVAWQFHRAAYFSVPAEDHDPDEIFLLAADAGADDVDFDNETIEIIGPVDSFKEIGNHLKSAGINPEEAEMRYLPDMEMELPQEQSIQVVKVIETLQELDDVQDVYTNLKLSEDIMAELETA